MASSSRPLSLDDIRSTLATQELGQHLHLHREVASTNATLLALAQSGAEHGTVVVADSQTAGRGRQARTWFSPSGMNLYCSILIRAGDLRIPFAEWLSWIPLGSAVAIAEAVRTVTGTRLALKWPNDLLINDRKLGGVLCEQGVDRGKQPFVIIGIGLNVNTTREVFPQELADIAISLMEICERPIDRNRLLSEILNDLETVLNELRSEGARRLQHAYTAACATVGRRIRVALAESHEVVGVAEGIVLDGALLVRPLDRSASPVIEVRAADVIHLRE